MMKILVLNSGSSTLKFDLAQINAGGEFRRLARGMVDRIGAQAEFSTEAVGATQRKRVSVADHHEAVSVALDWLARAVPTPIDAVGHRVVHGGERFVAPARVNDAMLAALGELSDLAPLHNPTALQAIGASREILGRDMPMAAVFDTAFFHALPPRAATYALPREIIERHRIRRYGFHGIAHESMLRRYAEIQRVPVERATLITLQLGNGCSVAAIQEGRAVDTSMGFTPLEGLVMGTRCGDLDANLVSFIALKEKVPMAALERILNKESGLLGVSGISADMRELLAAETTDSRAALAIELFCYRARKYIGAYLAALGGAQAILFGGGIGENSPEIRARICEGMNWCGVRIDARRNAQALGREGRVGADDSAVQLWTIAVDEARVIAQHTRHLFATQGGGI